MCPASNWKGLVFILLLPPLLPSHNMWKVSKNTRFFCIFYTFSRIFLRIFKTHLDSLKCTKIVNHFATSGSRGPFCILRYGQKKTKNKKQLLFCAVSVFFWRFPIFWRIFPQMESLKLYRNSGHFATSRALIALFVSEISPFF